MERVLAWGRASIHPDRTLAEVEGKVLEIDRLIPAEVARRGRPRKPAEARALMAALAVRWDMATVPAVARRYHRDVATRSEAVRRVQRRVKSSRVFREHYETWVNSVAK